jgi:hypothetical protein
MVTIRQTWEAFWTLRTVSEPLWVRINGFWWWLLMEHIQIRKGGSLGDVPQNWTVNNKNSLYFGLLFLWVDVTMFLPFLLWVIYKTGRRVNWVVKRVRRSIVKKKLRILVEAPCGKGRAFPLKGGTLPRVKGAESSDRSSPPWTRVKSKEIKVSPEDIGIPQGGSYCQFSHSQPRQRQMSPLPDKSGDLPGTLHLFNTSNFHLHKRGCSHRTEWQKSCLPKTEMVKKIRNSNQKLKL